MARRFLPSSLSASKPRAFPTNSSPFGPLRNFTCSSPQTRLGLLLLSTDIRNWSLLSFSSLQLNNGLQKDNTSSFSSL
ncbi:hypothetical protein FGO68_gene11677 [Halteria grandinella]|uniref:Uncharacterized protein n=1 Tax=Halteria grandinella TaxID=5974 RepID=A0A8J8P3C2_HALGN|nr:hypothetical protein FGO68_gene11677 [Halteria grandinella]